MAEAYRLSTPMIENKFANNQDESYCLLNVLSVFISLVTILADLTTDILVFAEYCHDGQFYWGMATMVLICTPNVLLNIFSMRWYINDQKTSYRHWITHACLVGFLERYIVFLYKVFSCKNLEAIKTQKWVTQRNDLCLLHFLYVFTGTVPQIILQSYAIVALDEHYYTKVFALSASIASVTWSCTMYLYNTVVFTTEKFQWRSFSLKLLGHFGMLIGRIPSILVFTIIFGIWTLIPMGVHWFIMTLWIIMQKNTFCSNKYEQTLYNVLMGLVFCFCFINLQESATRYRLMMFYMLIVTQNFGILLLYVLISNYNQLNKPWSIGTTVCIITGTLIGVSAMIIYYRCFRSNELKVEDENSIYDIELNNKVFKKDAEDNKTSNKVNSTGISEVDRNSRKKKYRKKKYKKVSSPDPISKNESQNADKKNLLDHWMAISGTPTLTPATFANTSMDVSSIEVYTIQNTPQSGVATREDHEYVASDNRLSKQLKTVCSPTELMLKLSAIENIESSIDEITSNSLNLQKRRGICSSDVLSEDLSNIHLDNILTNDNFIKTIKTDRSSEISRDTDGSNKKTSSDSIDMDLDLSFSDINSSDINTFNENIVQKLCLSALKNIKVGNQDADIENIQRIALDILKEMYTKKDKSKNKINKDSFNGKQRDLDTPTEMLSVHDYENICAVNIAREAWGLRSWNVYSDIENWQHDGSVVRERRGDTLTSESSESSSCLSQELKNAILAAPPFPKKVPTYSNISIKFDSGHEDYANTPSCHSIDETFLAKPCITDFVKDPNQLEPIIEELDDLCDIESQAKKRLNSESSLVATIDEISKAFATNSPRNLYHRSEHLWDSPQCGASVSIENTLKKALWKEPSKFDPSNIMESLPEKENILNVSHGSKFDTKQNCTRVLKISSSAEGIESDQANCRNSNRIQKTNMCNIKLQSKILNNQPEHHLHDLLWQLVSESSLPHSSAEDMSASRISTSLQSLIQKDPSAPSMNTTIPKITNIKKGVRSRPRRKFSILRERFEPKTNLNSDKEILCHGSEGLSCPLDTNIVNLKNDFDISEKSQPEIKNNNSSSPAAEFTSSKSIKEKRSLFMKQVLSPPKFNTKLRHKMY